MNTPTTWKTESGTVSICPEHGRVLGIEVSGHEALWRPAAFEGGWNLGGERLWIGPEADWFWQRVGKPDFSLYQVPADLNPDRWTVTRREADSCHSEIELSLQCAHRDARVRLGISRTFCDSPMDLPGTQGDALQFFNDDGSFGCFGEMEHRSPAIVCGTGPQKLVESTVTCVSFFPEPGFIAWKAGFAAR